MKSTVNSVIDAALQLDDVSRAEIAQRLLDSLDDSSLENEWVELAENRLKDIKEGKVELISWEQLKKTLS